MTWLIWLAALTAAIALWVALIRPWLCQQWWAKPFFNYIEPFERFAYLKSESILWARTKQLVGVLLTVLTQLGAIDITPLLPVIPDQYDAWILVGWNMLPMVIAVVGWLDERMRSKDTTKPIELVAVSDKILAANPGVAEKVAAAEVAKVEAVEAVKATGSV
jgi:hypothetical protein